jgi:hypothetical protein
MNIWGFQEMASTMFCERHLGSLLVDDYKIKDLHGLLEMV